MNIQKNKFSLKKPLHILFLARWYPHKFDKMYGLFVRRHAEAAALKHQVSVIYVHACKELESKSVVEIKKGYINEYYYYYQTAKTGIGLLNSILNIYRFLRGHWVLSRKISPPNLIHVHILTRLGIIAYFVHKWKHIPFVITEHWSRYQQGNRGFEGFWRKYLTRLVTANASALTTVTMNLKDAMEMHRVKNNNHHILNNVVDIKVFFPENRAYKKAETKKLVHVSCFDDEPKNISGLLDCIKELADKREDFTIEMIGTGKDFDKIVSRSKELGLYGTRMVFTGELEGQELGEKMRSADVLLLFSNYENMPVVINEAFCCGVPVISTDVGGIKEFVHPNNGKLVPKGDKKKFVHELNEMLDHLEKYDQKEISETAKKMFSVSSVSEKLDEIYTKTTYT